MLNRISRYWFNKTLGMFFIRAATGLIFIMLGWMKLQSLPMMNSFFTNKLGLPPGTATFIALVELIGGLMLILGVWARVAGVVLGIEMLVAIFITLPTSQAFGGHELEIMLMATSFGVALTGPAACASRISSSTIKKLV
ncbi:MAG: DoxX family protein [Patescibacteria group bacterium]|nr:DoxX family protein [Patescibacteria group bacterium]